MAQSSAVVRPVVPSSAPCGLPPTPYVTKRLSLAHGRAARFRFELTGPVIKKHVGAAALAIIHAVSPLAQKHKGGTFFTSVDWIVRFARTQDGRPLTPKQIKTGLRRATEVGLLEAGEWRYRWNKRASCMGRTYERELRCWPDPRAAGRCYMVDGTVKRRVEKMAGHGGKRAGSGPKKGAKYKPSTKPRRNPHISMEDQEALFTPLLLAPVTQYTYIDRRGLKPRRSGAKKVQVQDVQVGPPDSQGGPYTSSLREEEESCSSFGRNNGVGNPTPLSNFSKSGSDATLSPPAATLEAGVPLDPPPTSPPPANQEHYEPAPGSTVFGTLSATPHRMPPGLPPFPSRHYIGSYTTPKPPLLRPEMDEDERIDRLLRAYRGGVCAEDKGRKFARERPPTGKERRALLDCADAMIAESVAPAMWVMFSCEIWADYQGGKGAPPRRWVFNADRVLKHHGWFHNGWDGALASRVIHAPEGKECGRRWYAMTAAVRAERPISTETVQEIVARFFPGDLFSHLCEQSLFTCKRKQREMNERAMAGDWVW